MKILYIIIFIIFLQATPQLVSASTGYSVTIAGDGDTTYLHQRAHQLLIVENKSTTTIVEGVSLTFSPENIVGLKLQKLLIIYNGRRICNFKAKQLLISQVCNVGDLQPGDKVYAHLYYTGTKISYNNVVRWFVTHDGYTTDYGLGFHTVKK